MAIIGLAPSSISPEAVKLLDEINDLIQKVSVQAGNVVAIAADIEQKRQQLWDRETIDKFFFYNLIFDKTFSKNAYFEKLTYCAPKLAIKCKRGATFCMMLDEYFLNDYTDDLDIIKKRRGIDNNAQFPKIAGLMANLIVKYRPIVPINLCDDPAPDINENFAIFHAICICTDYEGGQNDFAAFQSSDQDYRAFYKEVGYLLKRNFTPESLISLFKTLCLYKFPKALETPASE
jgi:hypothetical protein